MFDRRVRINVTDYSYQKKLSKTCDLESFPLSRQIAVSFTRDVTLLQAVPRRLYNRQASWLSIAPLIRERVRVA
jgi:hypothetical protein